MDGSVKIKQAQLSTNSRVEEDISYNRTVTNNNTVPDTIFSYYRQYLFVAQSAKNSRNIKYLLLFHM